MTTGFTNTNRVIWRQRPGDAYAPIIYVTESGGIAIDCGGHVIVAPVERWHDCGEKLLCVDPSLSSWRWKLARWAMGWNKKRRIQPQ